MKKYSLLVLLYIVAGLSTSAVNAQRLVKLWETDTSFKVPESTLYYPEENIIFVSNIDGMANEKDSKGSISKLGPDGKVVQHNWATNLDAPKGMGIYNKQLFVADLDEVVVLDLSNGKMVDRIPVPGAIFLNDIAITPGGTVYVSDTRKGIIHRISNRVVTTWIDNKIGANGLLITGDDLIFAAKDTLWKASPDKVLLKITDGMDLSSDGIVETAGKDLIVSCWAGIIYYVHKDGRKTVLTDLRPEKINTADIGFDPVNNILYVPTFFKNTVMAFKVEQ